MRVLTALVATALTAGTASAQIVDVQNRFAGDAKEGLSGALEFSIDWRTGSNDYLTMVGGFTASWVSKEHQLLTLLQGEYGISRQEQTLGRTLEHLRYRYAHTDRLSTEVFIQHELNPFRRLVLRGLVGAGPRVKIARGEHFYAAVGVALMGEHERLRIDSEVDAGQNRTDPRLSSYVIGRFQFFERMSLSETLYLQPRLTRFADFRILNETALTVKATERIAMTFGFLLYLDREPPAGVSPFDTQLRSALAVSF